MIVATSQGLNLLQQRRARAPFTASQPAIRRPSALSRRIHGFVARAEQERNSSSSVAPTQQQQQQQQPEEADEDTLAEKQLLSKRRKPKEPKARPQVISAARDQVYGGGPLTSEQIMENRVVQSLAILFFVIMGEGLFLGASGFMSESVDQFAQDTIYPLFSPSIGLFLLGSSIYGLWKTYFQGRGGAPEKKN